MGKKNQAQVPQNDGAEENKQVAEQDIGDGVSAVDTEEPTTEEPIVESAQEGEATDLPDQFEQPAQVPQNDGAEENKQDDYEGDDEVPEADDVAKFSKEQLLSSSMYSHRRDALNSLLKDDEMYSHTEVVKKLDKFYKQEVK